VHKQLANPKLKSIPIANMLSLIIWSKLTNILR